MRAKVISSLPIGEDTGVVKNNTGNQGKVDVLQDSDIVVNVDQDWDAFLIETL